MGRGLQEIRRHGRKLMTSSNDQSGSCHVGRSKPSMVLMSRWPQVESKPSF
jgi:hypothetical protein